MNERPLVSVLMTAYNRENFITEAIESVLASTYADFELIVVDDCSADNTVTIARSFEQKDTRIKVHVNEKNLGDYPNRNRAAAYARGEFIMFLDSDDMILENGIENCVNAMLKYPQAGFGMYSTSNEKETYTLSPAKALRRHFFSRPFLMIGPGGTITRRFFFEKINGYPEKYGPANDLYFNLKACSSGGVVMMPFEFVFYRRHEQQEINNHYSYLYNNYCYLRDALMELNLGMGKEEIKWLNKKNKRRFIVNVVKYLMAKRNIKSAKEAMAKARFGFRDAVTGIFH